MRVDRPEGVTTTSCKGVQSPDFSSLILMTLDAHWRESNVELFYEKMRHVALGMTDDMAPLSCRTYIGTYLVQYTVTTYISYIWTKIST